MVGKMYCSSRRKTVRPWPGVQIGRVFDHHSRATASNVLASDLVRATLSALRVSLGSSPFASSRRMSPRRHQRWGSVALFRFASYIILLQNNVWQYAPSPDGQHRERRTRPSAHPRSARAAADFRPSGDLLSVRRTGPLSEDVHAHGSLTFRRHRGGDAAPSSHARPASSAL